MHIHLAGLTGYRYPDVTPHDYYFPSQWGLHKIKCPDAWRYTNGKSSVIIQIIDGGTDYGHPDLVRNIWQNLGEDADGDGHTIEWNASQNRWILDPGDLNGYDDDYNGYCDDLVGFDFTNSPCGPDSGYDPQPTNEITNQWIDHGDKTAGTAAAVTDKRIGVSEATWICSHDTNNVAGTSWFNRIMIARFGKPGYEDVEAINAIKYAKTQGAKIISMSWGSTTDDAALHAALDSAYNGGILLIASAGNNIYDTPTYPASYLNVIAVAATDSNDVKEGYSNYGTWVDICSPGRNISPMRDNKWWQYYCYGSWVGTSVSAPFIAGVAAMVWSCNPSATNVQVKNAILSTADNIYNIPGNSQYIGKLGSGRVNALNAVKVFRPVAPPPGDCNSNIVVEAGDIVYLINYLFQHGSPPDPFCVGDVNGSGTIEVGDISTLISYLYRGGSPPLDGCH